MTTFGRLYRAVAISIGLLSASIGSSVSQKAAIGQLAEIGVQVNGESRRLLAGDTLHLIRGDMLMLEYASLLGTRRGPSLLDFVGFRDGGADGRLKDDRYSSIDTAMLTGNPAHFRIEARSGKRMHGKIPISFTEPVLKELMLTINGVKRSVYPGTSLLLKKSDSFQVLEVKTNEIEIDRHVRVSMESLSSPFQGMEIKLFYRSHGFASIRVLLHPEGVSESRGTGLILSGDSQSGAKN